MTWNVLTTWHVTLSRMLGTWHDSPQSQEHSGLISQGKQEGGETWQKINMKWRLTAQSHQQRKTAMKVKFVTDVWWATRFLSWRHLTLAPRQGSGAPTGAQSEKHKSIVCRPGSGCRPMLVLLGDWFRSLKDGFCSVMNEGHPTCYYPCRTGSGWNCFQLLVKSIIDK